MSDNSKKHGSPAFCKLQGLIAQDFGAGVGSDLPKRINQIKKVLDDDTLSFEEYLKVIRLTEKVADDSLEFVVTLIETFIPALKEVAWEAMDASSKLDNVTNTQNADRLAEILCPIKAKWGRKNS